MARRSVAEKKAKDAGLRRVQSSSHFIEVSDRTRRRFFWPVVFCLVAVWLAPTPPIPDPRPILNPMMEEAVKLLPQEYIEHFERLSEDFERLTADLNNPLNQAFGPGMERPGLAAVDRGIRKKYPVVIIPGATTTGLEIWQGKACAKASFKQRLWGSVSMLSSLASMDSSCWLEHISLNTTTGLDPEGIKVRPAEGMSNVEYFMPGFWLWAIITESLADIGYDSSDMYAHTYDWRLSPELLEKRDGLLTRMKHTFEYSYEIHKKPACILSHSYGDYVARYFMSWVASDQGGGGGKHWVNKYIARYVNIGGHVLGVPKALTGITSGDTSDSIWLPDFAPYLTDRNHLLTKSGRAQWFRSMTSGKAMLPQGGKIIWGHKTSSLDDTSINNNSAFSHGTFMCVGGDTDHFGEKNERGCVPLSVSDAFDLMFNRSGDLIKQNMDDINAEYGKPSLEGKLRRSKSKSSTFWGHALLEPLPLAPHLKIYCFYGVGVPTERSYVFKYDASRDDLHIDTSVTIPEWKVEKGVQYSDGDGTVPLSSLSYMCMEGWKKKKLNPASIEVRTKEYVHDPAKLSMRGGPKASDHVNILGNYEMILDILEIAGGLDVEERITTNIKDKFNAVKV